MYTYSSNHSGTVAKSKAAKSQTYKKLDDEIINFQQFSQIVGAIIAGKYSWACVLFLYWANYNPLHYIPYRTYNRLMKENIHGDSEKSPESKRELAKMLFVEKT